MRLLKRLVVMIAFGAALSAQAAPTGNVRFSISGPVTLIEGDAFWGGYASLMYEATPEILLGLETGFQTRSETGLLGSSASLSIIPVLPKVLYRFVAGEALKPFVGAGVGVGIWSGSVDAGPFSGTNSGAKLEFLGHVGTYFGTTDNFLIDMRIGDFNGHFVFAPSIGFQI